MIADTNALLTKEVVAVTLLAAMVGAGALRAKANKNSAILWGTGFAASVLMFGWIAESLGFLTGFLEIVCAITVLDAVQSSLQSWSCRKSSEYDAVNSLSRLQVCCGTSGVRDNKTQATNEDIDDGLF